MAALVEGHQYGLSSCGQHSANKTVVYVKLTDSALKAIKDYQKNNACSSRSSTIQLLGNHGTIYIPNVVSSSCPDENHSFDFTLSSLQSEGPQGSFECIEQHHNVSLESLGSMQHKVLIHAKEDVYQKTKEKMTLVEEECKKNSTKVIKASGPYVGRKVKVKKPGAIIPPKVASFSPHSAIGSSNSKVSHHNSSHSVKTSNSNTILTHNVAPLANQNLNISTKHSSSSKQVNSDIRKRSYRDRIIHLIAVRPYKKPELLTRLMKDGIREKDKNSLSVILPQVATMKDNSYNLAKHVYSELQPDWPYYSEIDRQIVKRRMAQIDLSPSNSQPGSASPLPPTLTSQKRPNSPTSETILSANLSKKQRISHYNNKQTEFKPDSNGFIHSSSSNNSSSPPEKYDQPSPDRTSHEVINQVPANCTLSAASPYPDYLSKYIVISSSEQRQRYKQDFNGEYDEYRELYKNIQKVAKKFITLEENLRQAKEGSDEWHKIRQKIFTEYQENVQDPKYQEQRKRLQYLQEKLSHIKRLVLEYDHAHIADL